MKVHAKGGLLWYEDGTSGGGFALCGLRGFFAYDPKLVGVTCKRCLKKMRQLELPFGSPRSPPTP